MSQPTLFPDPVRPPMQRRSDRPRAELGHVRQLSKREAKATPLPFRDLLLDMARSCAPTGGTVRRGFSLAQNEQLP